MPARRNNSKDPSLVCTLTSYLFSAVSGCPSYLGLTRKGVLINHVSYETRLQVVNIFGHSKPWLKVYNFDGA